MNKLTIILLLLSVSVKAQNLDSLGIDANATLNKYEAAYFSNRFSMKKSGFDYLNKRALFVTGSSAKYIETKKEYFKLVKNRAETSHVVPTNVYILKEKDRNILPDYDVVIYYYTKAKFSSANVKSIKRQLDKQVN